MSKTGLDEVVDHPGTLKAIMTTPPTSQQAHARLLRERTQMRRSIEDKNDARSLSGKDVI